MSIRTSEPQNISTAEPQICVRVKNMFFSFFLKNKMKWKYIIEDRRIIKTIDGVTTECFYISTTPPEDIPEEAGLTQDEISTLPF